MSHPNDHVGVQERSWRTVAVLRRIVDPPPSRLPLPSPVAVAPCACGGILSAPDDLEHKRLAAVEHVGTARHQTWRGRQTW